MTETTTLNATQAAQAGRLLKGYTIEITARDRRNIDPIKAVLPKGTEMYIAHAHGGRTDVIVEAAKVMRANGLEPVPHLVARNVQSLQQLEELVKQLTGEAGVNKALIPGGDAAKPDGPLSSSIELLRTGILQKHGIKRINISCYAETHSVIPDNVVDEHRAMKLELIEKEGIETELVSQFAFEPDLMVAMVKRLRSLGVKQPVRIGVAGPNDRASLVKYAIMCGIGNSLKALTQRPESVGKLMTREGPDDIVAAVGAAQEADPSLNIAGIHFFTFGAVVESAQWANNLIAKA
jgi:methylenetetrahydrofolate reductase (NADPH)